MNTVKMPGFTAEASVYSAYGQFHAVASDHVYVSDAEVRPQKIICHRDPDLGMTCVDATCRMHCLQSKKGAALRKCLADC